MHPYPHIYKVSAAAASVGIVTLGAASLPDLESAPPPEFDGPGGYWSPESLLCAAVADCFILTFRAIARASLFDWSRLECRVEGILDRVERVPKFKSFVTYATLQVAPGADATKARALLAKAEHDCLISNSLSGARNLEADVIGA